MANVVEITINGSDVTAHVLWSSAKFESQQNATPGTFEFTMKDPDRTLTPPVTGDEVILTIDGSRQFGGYVLQVGRVFAFPAAKLPTTSRQFTVRGVDYNILFDKRVTRNPAALLVALPTFTGADFDGDLIKDFCANYLDLPSGFDSTTYVDNITRPASFSLEDGAKVGAWKQQGTTWREQMELITQFSGAVWYIDPNLKLHHHAIESVVAPFSFSDAPSPPSSIGMRDVTATEDGSVIVNDALVWGGSEWTEGAVFSREQNAGSITTHKRWQTAETHFGEEFFLLQDGVDARADLIVNGGATVAPGFNPGLAYPQWAIDLTWFGRDVPGSVHLHAGQLVTVDLTTMGGALSPITLPMRSVTISFAGLDPNGDGHAVFRGSLGLQLGDPFTVWAFLLRSRRVRPQAVAAATNATTASTYGSFGQFEPVLESGLTYRLPNNLGYIANTTQVYAGGLLQARDVAYTESDPVAGRITFSSAPAGDLWVVCRTT